MTPLIHSLIYSFLVKDCVTQESAHISVFSSLHFHKLNTPVSPASRHRAGEPPSHYPDVDSTDYFYLFLAFIYMEMYSIYSFCLAFFAPCYVCEIHFFVAGSYIDSSSLLCTERELGGGEIILFASQGISGYTWRDFWMSQFERAQGATGTSG